MLAMMCRTAPHLMVLDEPSNHLDIDAREALVQALNDFKGALVLITHDPHLIEACADRLWLVADNRVTSFDGDVEDYRRQLLSERGTPGPGPSEPAAGGAKLNKREARRAKAREREDRADLRRASKQAEALVDKRGAEKATLDAELADPALYQGATNTVTVLLKRRDAAARRLADAEAKWLDAQHALDQAAE